MNPSRRGFILKAASAGAVISLAYNAWPYDSGEGELTVDAQEGGKMVAMDVDSVKDLQDIDTGNLKDGQQISVLSYHVPVFPSTTFIGGGLFAWDSSRAKANHDGGRVISPTAPWGDISDFLSGVGETDASGTGCFVRVAEKISIEDFGAYEGQPAVDSTSVINHAVEVLQGDPLYIPAKRYKYDGEINSSVTTLIGERMPNVNASRTALENGSILEGTFLSRSLNVHIENIGVDHGSAAFPDMAADAFKVSPSMADAGKSANIESVVGLGRAPEDQYHAVLIEGYSDVKARNLIGVRTYYGVVFKGVRVNANNITAIENGLYGCIIKADTTSGDSADVVVNGIIHDGMGVSGLGLQIESSDDDIRRIMVSNLNVRNSGGVYRVAGDVLAGDIVVSGVVGSNITGDAIRQTGTAYALSTSDIVLTNIDARAVNMANVRHLNISGLTAAADSENTHFLTDFVLVGASSRRTSMQGIDLSNNYSTADGSGGMIKYDNERGQNAISEGYYRLSGVGAPVSSVTTVASEPPSPSTLDTYKVSLVRLNYTSTGPLAHRLKTNNTDQGHRIVVHNNTGGSQVVANSTGSTLKALSDGQYGEFILAGDEFIYSHSGTL